MGDSRDRVVAFPEKARAEAGYQLYRLQCHLEPENWKPMSEIGSGVQEIRIKDTSGEYRVIYVAKFGDDVVVLHAFKKTTQKTSMHDKKLAAKRYKEVEGARRKAK